MKMENQISFTKSFYSEQDIFDAKEAFADDADIHISKSQSSFAVKITSKSIEDLSADKISNEFANFVLGCAIDRIRRGE